MQYIILVIFTLVCSMGKKVFKRHGKKYDIIPEIESKTCKGCAFEFKNGCYHNVKLTEICRQGNIFVPKKD